MKIPKSIDELYRKATEFRPYEYQRLIAQDGMGDVLAAPTGAGKTEAVVLGWIWHKYGHDDLAVREGTPSRLIIMLPTRSLTDQTVKRIRTALENLGLDKQIPVIQLMGGTLKKQPHSWRSRIDEPMIIVTTVDCGVSRILNRGYGSRRTMYPVEFALFTNDAHIVIDEVQLCPQAAHTARQIQGLVKMFGTAAPFALTCMSATVNPHVLSTVNNPECTTSSRLDEAVAADARLAPRRDAQRLITELTIKDEKALASHVLSEHEDNTISLVVVNNVDTAQNVMKHLLKTKGLTVPLLLIHSRFRPIERQTLQERLAEVTASEKSGAIIVSTQALEAGIDLDARRLYTELAPWPSLIQRMGRCNRSGKKEYGLVSWFKPFKPAKQPYEASDLDASKTALQELPSGPMTQAHYAGLVPPDDSYVPHTLHDDDLLSLYDTSFDLSGRDIDVSVYIRDKEPLDVYVAWVADPQTAKRPDKSLWCPVPIAKAPALVKGFAAQEACVFDPSQQKRVSAQAKRLAPGDLILMSPACGGYDVDLGYLPNHKKQVVAPHVSGVEEQEDSDKNAPDNLSGSTVWVTLKQHSNDTRRFAQQLWKSLNPKGLPNLQTCVEVSSWAHDIGKAFGPWQEAVIAMAIDRCPDSSGLWAKSKTREKDSETSPPDGSLSSENGLEPPPPIDSTQRKRPIPLRVENHPGFRHEFASTIALRSPEGRQWLTTQGVAEEQHSLCHYLVAAHHGKVRMRLTNPDGDIGTPPRLLGLTDDTNVRVLFPADHDTASIHSLDMRDLTRMDTGWEASAAQLLSEYGPFTLAYLETLVRVADWRASAYAEGASS